MGVRQCSRKDCETVLCDHYNHDHGYICCDCLNELRNCVDIQGTVNVFEFMRTSVRKDNTIVTSQTDINNMFSDRG